MQWRLKPTCRTLLVYRHFLRKRSKRTTSPVDGSLLDVGSRTGLAAFVVAVCGPASFLRGGLGDFAAGACFAGEGFSAGAGFAAEAFAGTSVLASVVTFDAKVNCSPN